MLDQNIQVKGKGGPKKLSIDAWKNTDLGLRGMNITHTILVKNTDYIQEGVGVINIIHKTSSFWFQFFLERSEKLTHLNT